MDVIYLDLETTGLDPHKDEIIQLAYALDNSKQVFNKVYKPSGLIPYEVSGLTNIDQKDVVDKEKFVESEDLENLKKISDEDVVIVTHNTDFDLGFLEALGVRFPKSICTLLIARRMIGNKLVNHKLGTLRAFYNIPVPSENQAHNAEYDVVVLREIFEKMKGNFDSLEEMINYSAEAKRELLKIWSFGKYKGERISKEKHGDYIKWFLEQPANPKYPHPPEFIKLLQNILKRAGGEKQSFPDGKLF